VCRKTAQDASDVAFRNSTSSLARHFSIGLRLGENTLGGNEPSYTLILESKMVQVHRKNLHRVIFAIKSAAALLNFELSFVVTS
jgi:hypothetical protein